MTELQQELQNLEPWEIIEHYLQEKDALGLNAYLETLPSGDVARALSRLDDDDQAGVLLLLSPEKAADILEQIWYVLGADVIEELEPHEAAAIIDEMESDHRVDLLGEMYSDAAEAILEKMDPEEAEDARQLLTYAEDCAGGVMVTEYLSYPIHFQVSDVLKDLRENAELYSDYGVQYAYVLSESSRLVGVLRLRDLVLSHADTPIGTVMMPNPLYVTVDTPLDELMQFFDRYSFVGVPVTDRDGRLVGVVRRADAEEAYSERAEQTYMRFGGIIGGEELRSMPLLLRSSRRLIWLVINLGLSLVAASVILKFQDTIQAFLAIVFFLPVIANLSGCSGSQAVAVSIRELSVGVIQPRDALLVLLKEAQVGMINGFVIGLLLAVVGAVMFGAPILGLVVGTALCINSVFALCLGGVTPLFLRRYGMDPALVAPLILTTVTDMTGFLLALVFLSLVSGFIT